MDPNKVRIINWASAAGEWIWRRLGKSWGINKVLALCGVRWGENWEHWMWGHGLNAVSPLWMEPSISYITGV